MSIVTRPRLSILIFTYNRERMLTQCLDSVAPTTADCEIAIYDDASTDGTPELIRTYADQDPRIRYVRQPHNVGVTANIETALKEARGEFVAMLADDDSVEPGNYERKVAILEAYPEIGLVYSLAYMTDDQLLNRQIFQRTEYLDHSYIGGRAEFSDLLSGNYIAGNSVVFRQSLLQGQGLIDRNLPPGALALSDWDMWLRFAFRAETAFINEPLVNVRMHTSSLSSRVSSDMALGMISVWQKWLVNSREPPALDKRTWARMEAVFLSEVQRLHGNEPDVAQACVTAFAELREAAAANASQAFARRTRYIPTSPEPSAAASLVWTGPVWAISGMASDLRGLAAATAADGVPSISLRLEDLNWGVLATQAAPVERQRLNECLWRHLPAVNNHIYVWQGPLEYFRPDDGASATVARVTLEDGTPSPTLLQKANDLEAVWVPSQYHSDVLVEAGMPPEKLGVLPGCVDVGGAAGVEPVDLGTGRHFHLASMMHAQDSGLEVVLRAFAREFRPDEDVALVLIVRLPPTKTMEQLVEELQVLIRREVGPATKELPHINLRVGPLADDVVGTLLASSQAYVEPRPSTWGRGVLEAMARGLPVVGARIGPNVELLSRENSFSIGSETTPESLGRLMRKAFSAPEETRRRGVRARADVAAKHSPGVVAQRLAELVGELQTKAHR